MPDTNAPASAAAPKKRGCFGFVFKSALGCVAFGIGALVALILLLPTLLSPLVRSTGEQIFDQGHEGKLEIAEAKLAWFAPVTVRGVVLRDPEGREIAKASLVAPSLREILRYLGSGKLGRVELEVEAALVADDAGVTNLQRALKPRAGFDHDTDDEGSSRGDKELADELARLQAEVVVRAPRISWSDAETRRRGAPFELRDVEARLDAQPGSAMRVSAHGRVIAAEPGELSIDATIGGPIRPDAAWPFGPVDADVRVTGFSSAMVDGVAGLDGGLLELLGPRFDVVAHTKGATPERGDLSASLTSPRASVVVDGRFEGGALRSGERPFLVASIPPPRALVAHLFGSADPGATRIELVEGAQPWTARVTKLVLPIPPLDARTPAALAPHLAKLELDLDVVIPATVRVTNPAHAKLGPLSISNARARVVAAPGGDVRANVDLRLFDASADDVSIAVHAREAWAKLAANASPLVDVDARVRGIPMSRFDALVEPRSLSDVVGERADVALEVRDAEAPMPAPGGKAKDGGALALLEGARVRAKVTLAGTSPAKSAKSEGSVDVAVRELVAGAVIEPKKPLALDARATVFVARSTSSGTDTDRGKVARSEATLEARATIADPFAKLRDPKAELPPIDAHVDVRGLDGAVIDAFAGQQGLVSELFGGVATITADVKGLSTKGGSATATIAAPALDAKVAFRIESDTIVCAGDEGVDASFAPTRALFASQVAPRLPAGTRLVPDENAGRATVHVRNVRVPLAGEEKGLARVARIAARADVTLLALRYSDAKTDAAKRDVIVRDAKLAAVLDAAKPPSLRVDATIDDATPGTIVLDATALDPLAKLGEEHGLDTFRVRAHAQAANVPTAIIDLLAGQDGLLVEALGARSGLAFDAPDLSLDRGAFTAELTSDLHHVKAEGRLEKRVLRVEKVDGVVADIGLGPIASKRVVGNLVPVLVDVRKEAGAAPARFAVDGLSYPLDGDLSKLDAIVRLDLGQVSYSLLPGLSDLVGSLASMKSATLKPITVPIEKGVARYERLPIRVGAHEVPFRGSFNLVDRSLSLGADVPLALLGKKINSQLDAVREYLPPDLVVPIEIKGTWSKPRVSIAKSFLDDVVEKAAAKAAEKGLGGLLDGLLDKKKKKND